MNKRILSILLAVLTVISMIPFTATANTEKDVSGVINATLAKLADTVKEPSFGTNAGEWTVLCLARGEYYNRDNAYFADYYERIVDYVNTKAASINLNGALHKSKSTDNSRLILALSSIGKDATSVGNWNLITPYNDFDWIKKQGINGVIFALIALDSNNYQTEDITIRKQCLDYLLEKQLEGGGWAMTGQSFNTDITAMALQSLRPYKNIEGIEEAANRAFDRLSIEQLSTGGFLYGSGETSESAAQFVVACVAWEINPHTDSRFVKNGNSAIDNLLSYYVEEEAMFKHFIEGNTNDMATDQAAYALISYNRLINGKTSLYDYSDVVFESKEQESVGVPIAALGLPSEITDDLGKTFNTSVSLNKWDNAAEYKLIDFIVNVPKGLSVTNVTASNRLSGGSVSYNLEADTGKLRVVYFDGNNHNSLTVSGEALPVHLFDISFRVNSASADSKLNVSLGGMSLKVSSDYTDEGSMTVVDTSNATGSVAVVAGLSYSTVCLYTGDNIDLIPSSKKAVAVSVVGSNGTGNLIYNDGSNIYEFKYSGEISEKTGVATYVALVDTDVEMTNFINNANLSLSGNKADEILFGDANGDGTVNAQDALAAVDIWLRKTDVPDERTILAINVNSDSRINTFDALGIVEAFVCGDTYTVVTKAANLNVNN